MTTDKTTDIIDVHDIYNSIKNVRDRKDQQYEVIADNIVRKFADSLKNGDFSLQGENSISSRILWQWRPMRRLIKKKDADAQDGELDHGLLRQKVQSLLKSYDVRVGSVQEGTSSRTWRKFPLYCKFRYTRGGFLFRLIALPVDLLITTPVILAHNGGRKLQHVMSGVWYKTTLTLTISDELMSAIENLQPGASGYLEAKEQFENMAVGR